MEIYVVARPYGIENLQPGVHHYDNRNHRMTLLKEGDFSQGLQTAVADQESVGAAAVNIVMVAKFERATSKYGERGVQYVFQESGHISQNIFLQVSALGLGSVALGAFQEDEVRKVIGAPRNERPIYVQAIGVEKER